MKKGINFWAFEDGITAADAFRLAHDAGFEGVELTLAENEGPLTLSTTEEDCRKLAAEAAAAGVSLYSVATGLYWTYSLTSDDACNREKAKDVVKKQLQLAKWLGCGTILVVPGAVSVSFAPELGVVPYETAYNRSLAALKDLAPEAERLGVTIGIENVWNNFLLSPLEMRGFLDEIGSPFVKSFFDVGNVLFSYIWPAPLTAAGTDPEEALRITKLISRSHLWLYAEQAFASFTASIGYFSLSPN